MVQILFLFVKVANNQTKFKLSVMEEDDEVKSLLSGAFTGALFKSTAGARKCAMGTGMTIITFLFYLLKKEITYRGYSTIG